MKIKIQSVHFDADSKLLAFIETKLNKLTQYSDQIINADVVLRLEKAEDTQNKVVEIRLAIPGNDLFSKKQSKTFEEAVDLTAEALRTQLIKTKDKLR